jgi:hypothetical protein
VVVAVVAVVAVVVVETVIAYTIEENSHGS